MESLIRLGGEHGFYSLVSGDYFPDVDDENSLDFIFLKSYSLSINKIIMSYNRCFFGKSPNLEPSSQKST